MNIVDRLKQFMNVRRIAVTQFADFCDIPRPTISQLLNGRNKKVSDELVRKIHEAYPDLSVMWLMFGEGNMFVSTDTTSSTISDNRKESEPRANEKLQPGYTAPVSPDINTETLSASNVVSASVNIAALPDILPGDEDDSLQAFNDGQQTITLDFNQTDGSHTATDSRAAASSGPSSVQPTIADQRISESIEGKDTSAEAAPKANSIAFQPNPAKKIVNIIVYYSDNSYEAFGPLGK